MAVDKWDVIGVVECVVKTGSKAFFDKVPLRDSPEWKALVPALTKWIGIGPTELDDVIEGYLETGQVRGLDGKELPNLVKLMNDGDCWLPGAGAPVKTSGFRYVAAQPLVAAKPIISMATLQQLSRAMAARGAAAPVPPPPKKDTGKTIMIAGALGLAALMLLK